MSHLKQRREQICLNCNAQLSGPFCHICGQENIEPKETAWHLVTHFFNDITHFDGKFFSTLGLLIRKPGFLPMEYMQGRRASYLNPIRMYIFTSAVFFLIFFSLFKINNQSFDNVVLIDGVPVTDIRKLPADSLQRFTAKLNNGIPLDSAGLQQYIDSAIQHEGFSLTGSRYHSRQEYDSMLNAGVKKHNWLQRKLIYKQIEANEKYQHNSKLFFNSFVAKFTHSFPQLLFISLPIFALFLKLLYRRNKEYYYVSHGIFSIHFYIFTFITMLLIFTLGELRQSMHWEWVSFLQRLLGLAIFIYLYKAMRNFYQQRRAKTFGKFVLLSILSLVMMLLLALVFMLFSFMKI